MEIPVIVAARNEAQNIGRSLDTLSKQIYKVEPIVVVNGSTDRTADIARSTGARVLESDEGKMRAIQEGLRFLGKRALDDVLILDGDSRPFSNKWSRRLTAETRMLPAENPAIVWGPYVFSEDINPVAGAFFTATSMYISWADRRKESPRTVRGGNTCLKIRDDELLEDFLNLDNYWPREDVAILDTAMEHNANKKVVLSLEAWVLTSGVRLNEALKRIIKERRHASSIYDDSYASEAPPDSKPYYSES
jgi:glycosyltransferase involved in cell wall biosynthesis